MRRVIQHIRHKTRRHRPFLLILVIVFSFGLIVNFINGRYTEVRVVASFRKNFEKQALTQLDAYSFGLQSLLETRLSLQLSALENLVNNSDVRDSLLSGDYSAANAEFHDLISYDDRFDTIYVFNEEGVVILAVNRENDTSVVGTDGSEREYFKVPQTTKQPYIGSTFHTIRENDIMPFSIPVLDNKNNVVAVVSAGSTLDTIASSVSTPSDLDGLYYSVFDADGNIVLSQGDAPESITNVKNEDPIVASLVESARGDARSEINYLNDKVFTKGEVVEVGGHKFYVVSYYLISKYDHDLAIVQEDYRRTLATSRMRSLITLTLGAVIIYWVIRSHEKTTAL